ncbi:MAG: hypothetical protein WAO02_03965 [Verrucomicrobiia bacterium]
MEKTIDMTMSDAGRAGSPLPAANVVNHPRASRSPNGAHGVTRPTMPAAAFSAAILHLLFSILVLFSASARAQTTNFSQAFPGLSQAAIQGDLEGVNTNPAYVPKNLLAFMSSNYFNALPPGQPYLFDGGTQAGTASGSLTATGQVVTAPIVPDVIAVPVAAGGNVSFALLTVSNHSYTVSANADLTTANWNSVSNFTGDGYVKTVSLSVTNPVNFYKVSQP